MRHDPDFDNGDVAWEILGPNTFHTTLTFSVGSFVNTNNNAPDNIIFNKSYDTTNCMRIFFVCVCFFWLIICLIFWF